MDVPVEGSTGRIGIVSDLFNHYRTPEWLRFVYKSHIADTMPVSLKACIFKHLEDVFKRCSHIQEKSRRAIPNKIMPNSGLIAVVLMQEEEKRWERRRRRTCWVRRPQFKQFETLMTELKVEDAVSFRSFLSISKVFPRATGENWFHHPQGKHFLEAVTDWNLVSSCLSLFDTWRQEIVTDLYSMASGWPTALYYVISSLKSVKLSLMHTEMKSFFYLQPQTRRWPLQKNLKPNGIYHTALEIWMGNMGLSDVLLALDLFTSTIKGSSL